MTKSSYTLKNFQKIKRQPTFSRYLFHQCEPHQPFSGALYDPSAQHRKNTNNIYEIVSFNMKQEG